MTLGFLGDLLGLNNGDATIAAAKQNQSAIDTYGTTANGAIDTGAAQAGGYLNQANDLAGNQLAQVGSSYTESPGYQFALDQGLEALDRGAASRGMLGSGNTSADTINYATGAANQDYNQYLSNLNTATGANTSSLDNLANLATGTATAKTGVAGDVASGTMGANNQTAAGQTADTEGLSNLFGNIVGGGLSLATGGLSGLGSYLAKPKAATSSGFGYGGF